MNATNRSICPCILFLLLKKTMGIYFSNAANNGLYNTEMVWAQHKKKFYDKFYNHWKKLNWWSKNVFSSSTADCKRATNKFFMKIIKSRRSWRGERKLGRRQYWLKVVEIRRYSFVKRKRLRDGKRIRKG